LNNSLAAQSIPERTKQRILQAARELNYRPNFFARTLRLKRTFTLGVMASQKAVRLALEHLKNLVHEKIAFLKGQPTTLHSSPPRRCGGINPNRSRIERTAARKTAPVCRLQNPGSIAKNNVLWKIPSTERNNPHRATSAVTPIRVVTTANPATHHSMSPLYFGRGKAAKVDPIEVGLAIRPASRC
jgi:Bacterial regulatory proteins, lacI family